MLRKLVNYRQNWKNDLLFVPVTEYFIVPKVYPHIIQLREVPTFHLPLEISIAQEQVQLDIPLGEIQTLEAIDVDKIYNIVFSRITVDEQGEGGITQIPLTLVNNQKNETQFDYLNPHLDFTYWINFQTGEVEFNHSLQGKLVKIKYYGIGNLVYQEHVNQIRHYFDDQYYNQQDIFFDTKTEKVTQTISSKQSFSGINNLYRKYLEIKGLIPYYPIKVVDNLGNEINVIEMNQYENDVYHLILEEGSIPLTMSNYTVTYNKILNPYYSKEIKLIFRKFSQEYNDNYVFQYDKPNDRYLITNEQMGAQIGIQNLYLTDITDNKPYPIYKYDSNEFSILIRHLEEQNNGDKIVYRPVSKGHNHDGINSPLVSIDEIVVTTDTEKSLQRSTNSDIGYGFLNLFSSTKNGEYFNQEQETVLFFQDLTNLTDNMTFLYYLTDYKANIEQARYL